MIILELTRGNFIDLFEKSSYKDQFSYEALCALYEYYDNQSENLEDAFSFDFDVICAEWSEYNSVEDAAEYYGWRNEDEDGDAYFYLNRETYIIITDSESVLVAS